MDWVSLNIIEALWGANVVGEASNRGGMSSHVVILPLAKKRDDEVASELPGENLGKEVDIGDEGALEDDGNVGGVEELNWVWLSESSHLSAAQTQFDSESLQS